MTFVKILENKSYFTIRNRYDKNCFVSKTEYKFFYKYSNLFIKKNYPKLQLF